MIKKIWIHSSQQKRALFVFSILVFIRILFSSFIGLADDEAFHWSWSKDLDWSYFDHPGMVAWLEKGSTMLLGDTYWGVRLPSFVCFMASVSLAWYFAYDLFDEWTAHFVAMMMLTTPLWGWGGYVASPEPTFVLCWLISTMIFWQSIRPDGNRWSLKKSWILLGITMGMGINSKLITVLLAAGFGLFLLTSKEHRRILISPWPWVGFLIASLLVTPIFYWNLIHDWPSFRYQFHDRHMGELPSLDRWMKWFGVQISFYGPVLYGLILFSVGYAFKNWKDMRLRMLLCLALPSLFVFYPQPYFSDYKPHWPGNAHLLLTMIAASYWSAKYQNGKGRWLTWGQLVFLIPMNLFFYLPFTYPLLPLAHKALQPNKEWNTTWDLSNEFFGWEEFGSHLLQRQREIHAQSGKRPLLGALRYETTAQTWWGTKSAVIMFNWTPAHYTVVQEYRGELDNIKGSDALIVTTEKYTDDPLKRNIFETCQKEEYQTYRSGILSRTFEIHYCRNFQGLRNPPIRATGRKLL